MVQAVKDLSVKDLARSGQPMTDADISCVAAEIARRFDEVPMRTEDRLNDEYLRRVILEKAQEVLHEAKRRRRQIVAEQFRKLGWGGENLRPA
jgi:hypothetical protein